jgi:thiamine kinase-like enzyme
MKYYAESVLMLKENEKILFNDFLENHASRELSMAFERFEESFKKLDKLLKKLENDVEKFLNENGIELIDNENDIDSFLNENGIEFIDNENDIDSEIEHEKMLFIKPDTLSLFLDCLINNTVENIKIQRGYERRYPYLIYSFYCKDTGSATGKYMCVERIAEEERKQHIKNTIENLLKEAKEKFKNDMKEIHNLINEINESNKTILDELKKFEYKQIYDGDCEYIKYP